jgi:nucleoside-diphosphate-sugar epimerase
MNTAVITGASGFIGRALTKRLLQSGVKVYGVGRNSAKLRQLEQYGDFVSVQLDYSDYPKMAQSVRESEVDAFYHLAWLAFGSSSSSPEIQIANISGACNALYAAKDIHAKKFLMAGSYYEMKLRRTLQSANQLDSCINDSVFGICKHCAVELLRNLADICKMPYVSVCIPKIFGPGDKHNSAPVIIARKMLANEDVRLTPGDNFDDWVHIDDAAGGIIAAAGASRGKYYIGHRNLRTFKEIVCEMKSAVRSSSNLLFGEYPDNSFIDFGQIDLNALHSDTGWECEADFADSVRGLARWINSEKIGD